MTQGNLFGDRLDGARAQIAEVLKDPRARMDCPACTRVVMLGSRLPSKEPSNWIASAFAEFGLNVFQKDTVPGKKLAGGDYAKLRYWNLIEERTERVGYWAVTEIGASWILGETRCPKVWDFKSTPRVVDWSDSRSFSEATGRDFGDRPNERGLIYGDDPDETPRHR